MQTILIVEDEKPIVRLLQAYLTRAGYLVEAAMDGDEALVAYGQLRPALVLLDINLPRRNGWGVLEEIRKLGSTPVIMLTARGDVTDRLRGLQNGADDYIPKPFDPDEVVARVQAVLRRPPALVETDQVRIGSLAVDFTARSIALGGETLALAPRDWDLLAFFVRHPNQSFTRDQLLDRVWGFDYEGGDRAVDVAIKRLRQSLRDWPTEEGEIVTIRGMGYMLRA
ncbi:response regulator transcription factor [Tumebacillus sp. ITR2]|uniref:Response regulator transcription factor n=1 Tax=Tumebacillus amylolyticus TaxID=2801339 RepID=A0ABS1J7X8_9BACL|nr:response regulator transcription factor [Tumebacillus amylolyticus]MBL0386397.1 response regulator transcription factor [Tumebacillus amylolyticus]